MSASRTHQAPPLMLQHPCPHRLRLLPRQSDTSAPMASAVRWVKRQLPLDFMLKLGWAAGRVFADTEWFPWENIDW